MAPIKPKARPEQPEAFSLVKKAASLGDGKVILVGHSAGGMTISAVAEQVPEALLAVVYLAGFMVPNGLPLLAMLQFGDGAAAAIVTSEGNQLLPAITIPSNATSVTVSQYGVVSATIPGQSTASQLGTIQLANFVNPGGLDSIGNSLFTQTQASGNPVTKMMTGGRSSGSKDSSMANPSIAGISMSRKSRSGRSAASACRPLSASPHAATTSMPSAASSDESPSRASSSSSTTMARMRREVAFDSPGSRASPSSFTVSMERKREPESLRKDAQRS